MQAANRIALNTGFLYARMGITVFISLYSTRLVLQALGVDDFGIFSLVAGSIAMLTFLNSAMAGATQRFMSHAQGGGDFQRLKSIFNVSVVLHIIIAILIFFLLEVIGYFLFNGILKIPEVRIGAAKIIFQFAIIATLFTIISVPYDAILNAHENMLIFAILGIIESILKLAIAFYISYSNLDHLIIYGFLSCILSIFILIVLRIYCHKKYAESHIDFRSNFSKPIFKEMAGFASWSFLGASSSMLSNYGQGIVMNIFFGPLVNAAQGISTQVSGQLGAFAVTMLRALNPIIAKSEGAGDRALMLKASILGSKVSFFLLMLFYIPVLIEMPFVFGVWLKEVPGYAIIFCRLLLVRNLIEQLYITLTSTIAAVGNIRRYQIYISILTFFPLVISYILFMLHYPPYSLYIVFIAYALISFVITLYFANKNCNLSITIFFKDVIFRCIFLFVFIMSLSYIPVLIMQDGLTRLLLISCISTASFLILVWFIGFSFNERNSFKQILRLGIEKISSKNEFIRKSLLIFHYK